MQHDQESRTVSLWEIKYEDYQNCWYTLKTQESSTILTHRAVKTVLTFLIKFLLPRVQESLAAKLDAAKYTREDEYYWKRFRLSTCSKRSWWIIQWYKNFVDIMGVSENRRNWEKRERRTIAINAYILLFGKKNVWIVESVPCLWPTMPRVFGLVFKAWQFRVSSLRRFICKNFWPN